MLSVLGYSLPNHANARPGASLESCRVIVVYDGDTFGCDFNGNHRIDGQDEHVRMLGIDATEMHYSRKNKAGKDQPYALAAKAFVSRTALRKTVYLERDIKPFDKYHRRLSYVYLDRNRKTMLNIRLLEHGLARVLFLGPNRRHEPAFIAVERQARKQHLNLWKTASR